MCDRSVAEEYQRIYKAWEPVRKEAEQRIQAQIEREKLVADIEQRVERNAEMREWRMRNAFEDAQDEIRRQNQDMSMQYQLQMENMRMQMENMQMEQQNQMNNLRMQLDVW